MKRARCCPHFLLAVVLFAGVFFYAGCTDSVTGIEDRQPDRAVHDDATARHARPPDVQSADAVAGKPTSNNGPHLDRHAGGTIRLDGEASVAAPMDAGESVRLHGRPTRYGSVMAADRMGTSLDLHYLQAPSVLAELFWQMNEASQRPQQGRPAPSARRMLSRF